MASNIDPKINVEKNMKILEISQESKVLKPQKQCSHVAPCTFTQSASFKLIFEHFLKDHKNAKNNP